MLRNHLANWLISNLSLELSLSIERRMFSLSVIIVNLDQSDELIKEAHIISSRVPSGMTSKIWPKSSPNKIVFPLKGKLR